MTTYGTIPTESRASSTLSFFARAKEQIRLGLSSQRPWLELVQFNSFSLPISFTNAIERLKTNTLFFRVNYTIIILLTLFLSLLWQPVHFIIFLIVIIMWLFLYFLRCDDDDPFVIYGRVIDDSVVMMVLLVFTMIMLLLTDVINGIVIGFTVGATVISLHGVFRSTEDLFRMEDDEERVGAQIRDNTRHKNAASLSLSSS